MNRFPSIIVLYPLLSTLIPDKTTHASADHAWERPDSTTVQVTFQQDILPVLKTNCSPCHFEGGKVYDRYPFDDYATVKSLGKKLNTRLKEKEQKALLANWLNAGAREK